MRIRIAVLGVGQTHGEGDVVLDNNFTTTLKCIEHGSQAYVMSRRDFLRLFKTNEEAWRIMYSYAVEREKQITKACFNFVKVSNEEKNIMPE